jgi:predicted dehydrogenase
MLQGLQHADGVRVVGLADRDPAEAERIGRETGIPFYSDDRSLLAETRPAAIFVGAPPRASLDLISACEKREIHVWKAPPLGRNLDEAVAVVRRMDKAGLKLAIGTHRRFSAGYRRAWELRGQLGEVFLARGHYLFNWGPDLGWRGDKASAGGGALIDLGYHPIDLLVWTLGLPEEAYGISTTARRAADETEEAPRPVYDTDDTAAAILRYADGPMASVVTTRCSGPVSEEFCLHGGAGSIRADGESCLLRDPDGNALEQIRDESAPVAVFTRQAEAFARAVRDDTKTYECSGRENLLNMAVIEAIYLSDRTAQPEQPHELLRTHALTVEYCLSLRPKNNPEPEDSPAQALDDDGA